jgi:hypothetical protein
MGKSALMGTVLLACAAAACGGSGDASGSGEGGAGSSGAGAGPPTHGKEPAFARCGGAIFDRRGELDPDEYRRQARLWDRATIDCRLGPTFDELHPGADDDRPTAYEPPHQENPGGYLCPVFELSGTCSGGCDYGSTAGQVLYAPDEAGDPGVDRVQTYGYEAGHICESPQRGGWLGGPHPDPGVAQWNGELGSALPLPNGFAQSEMHQTNAGIMIFPNGFIGATGNQTAGDSKPHTRLPEHKVPTAVAVTLYNEIALVTVWDTRALKGQIAVFALRADMPDAFSVPYFALPNEGGFKNIQLLGYVDLPDMKTPTAIAANGNNGATPGGHVIGFEFGQQMEDPAVRQAFSRDDYERWVPTQGQAIVASRWEDKVTFVDLSPLFQFVRKVYFGTDADWQQAKAQDVWPFSFETNPEMVPKVVATRTIEQPTAVRVGNMPNGNAAGIQRLFKAWIADMTGHVHLYDISAFAADARPVPPESVTEIAKVEVGASLTSLSVLGSFIFNDDAIVTSRGERSISWVHVGETEATVTRTLRDRRLDDPVRADANDRGPVVTVADFHGKKILTFRVGKTEDNGNKPPANYGCGEGGSDADCASSEFGGALSFPGSPFFVGTTNVN